MFVQKRKKGEIKHFRNVFSRSSIDYRVDDCWGAVTARFTCSNKSNLLNINSAVTTRSCAVVMQFERFIVLQNLVNRPLPCLQQLQYNPVAVHTRPQLGKARHTCLNLHNVQQVTHVLAVYTRPQLGKPQQCSCSICSEVQIIFIFKCYHMGWC